MKLNAPIGIFDSGYGGLTILKEIVQLLPQYDYLYLGDNARAPYGNRSFETVYQYTLQCVQWFFNQGCPLVILACNTASAKALRTIQQKDLPMLAPANRVLGVIRPTAEVIGRYSKSGVVGLMATTGTVQSESYPLEVAKFFPSISLQQQACPLLVPIIENYEMDTVGADYFVKKYVDSLLQKAPDLDTVLMACTHYPLLENRIRHFLPASVQLVSQGPIVAQSLADYLNRHPDMKDRIGTNGQRHFFTTDDITDFERKARLFYGADIQANYAKVLF